MTTASLYQFSPPGDNEELHPVLTVPSSPLSHLSRPLTLEQQRLLLCLLLLASAQVISVQAEQYPEAEVPTSETLVHQARTPVGTILPTVAEGLRDAGVLHASAPIEPVLVPTVDFSSESAVPNKRQSFINVMKQSDVKIYAAYVSAAIAGIVYASTAAAFGTEAAMVMAAAVAVPLFFYMRRNEQAWQVDKSLDLEAEQAYVKKRETLATFRDCASIGRAVAIMLAGVAANNIFELAIGWPELAAMTLFCALLSIPWAKHRQAAQLKQENSYGAKVVAGAVKGVYIGSSAGFRVLALMMLMNPAAFTFSLVGMGVAMVVSGAFFATLTALKEGGLSDPGWVSKIESLDRGSKALFNGFKNPVTVGLVVLALLPIVAGSSAMIIACAAVIAVCLGYALLSASASLMDQQQQAAQTPVEATAVTTRAMSEPGQATVPLIVVADDEQPSKQSSHLIGVDDEPPSDNPITGIGLTQRQKSQSALEPVKPEKTQWGVPCTMWSVPNNNDRSTRQPAQPISTAAVYV